MYAGTCAGLRCCSLGVARLTFKAESLGVLELTEEVRLAGRLAVWLASEPQDWPVSTSPVLGLLEHTPSRPAFSHTFSGLASGPQACNAGAVQMEPSLHLSSHFAFVPHPLILATPGP